ncbi:MAG: shikimate dehydrogenase [Flavobacteriaceae bacterium]|nr:shikimate dehydrogenase [Flavobacteriaceae bacterium]
MSRFGLLGKHIDYSFSRSYFSKKFERHGMSHTYENFDMESIVGFREFIQTNQDLRGLNVTIPYKEKIIPFLDHLNPTAKMIGAVNTIKFLPNGELKGFNTDAFGFRESLTPLLLPYHKRALILGTGGASKAIRYVLDELRIPYTSVSRGSKHNKYLTYSDLNKNIISDHQIIINCTPLGTYPNVDRCPEIPYEHLKAGHLLYDLVYNPEITGFMREGIKNGTTVINGLSMLKFQAEKSWSIWMS